VALINLTASVFGIFIVVFAVDAWSLYGVATGLLVYESLIMVVVTVLALEQLGGNLHSFSSSMNNTRDAI